MKVFRDNLGVWHFGNYIVNQPLKIEFSEDYLDVKVSFSIGNTLDTIYDGLVTELIYVDSNGVESNFADYNDFEIKCSDFFVNALIARAYSRTIYKATEKREITGLTEQSVFSPSFVGTGLALYPYELRVGDILVLEANGIITTAQRGISTFKIYIGETKVYEASVTYRNNRTDYGTRTRITFTVRSTGVNGSIIMQGFQTTQTSDTQYTNSTNWIRSTAPIPIDTTKSLPIDITFQWGNSGQSLTISNCYIQKL